jgi:hypothetical protein
MTQAHSPVFPRLPLPCPLKGSRPSPLPDPQASGEVQAGASLPGPRGGME